MSATNENNIIYNINTDSSGKKSIDLSSESKAKLDAEQTRKLENLGSTSINTAMGLAEVSSIEMFKIVNIAKPLQVAQAVKVNAILLPAAYALYLADEKAKHGDQGIQSHVVAISQTIVGAGLATIGGMTGGAAGTVAMPVGGTIGGGIVGSMSASIFYDYKGEDGKSISSQVGDFVRGILPSQKQEQKQNIPNLDNKNYETTLGVKKDLNNVNIEHLMTAIGLDWNILFDAYQRQDTANIQNLDLLRNNPGNWWKSSSTNNNNNNGPKSNFQNPFDGGQGPGSNPPPQGPKFTPPTGGGSVPSHGGWGSFYQAASDFFRMGTAKPVSPFIQAAQDYKPAYKELYETAAKDSKTSSFKIEDPAWLYVGKKPDNYDKAKTEFKREVEHCLSSTYCTTSINDIASKVARGYFGVDSPSLVRTQTQNTGGYVGDRGWDPVMGVWVHALRKELGYAASHVSPLVLDLHGDGIKLYPYTHGVYFDIDNDGFAEKVGWLSENDGQLARDLNRNGQIDDITELFGDDKNFVIEINSYSATKSCTNLRYYH